MPKQVVLRVESYDVCCDCDLKTSYLSQAMVIRGLIICFGEIAHMILKLSSNTLLMEFWARLFKAFSA